MDLEVNEFFLIGDFIGKLCTTNTPENVSKDTLKEQLETSGLFTTRKDSFGNIIEDPDKMVDELPFVGWCFLLKRKESA